jgi:hypothetical protein
MTPEEWLKERLDLAETLMREHPPEPTGRPTTFEEFAEGMRGAVAVILLPTDHYLGLTIPEAEAVAAREGRILKDHTGFAGRRADLIWARVNITRGADGRIDSAATDTRPWEVATP